MTAKIKPKTEYDRERLRRLQERMNGSQREYQEDGVATRATTVTAAGFNPGQMRDRLGRWAKGLSGGSGKATGPKKAAAPSTGPSSPNALSTEELVQRGKMLESVLSKSSKLATDRTETEWNSEVGEAFWKPERDQLHREIVDELYAKAASVPNQGRSIIMGGPAGAGKTTTVRDHAGVDLSQYLVINPDDVKELFAERGLIPEIPGHPELSPMERSTLVHEESRRISQMLANRAYKDRKNVIWDITMASERTAKKHVKTMRAAGYDDVSAILVDVPESVSRRRVYDRYGQGVNDWLDGQGLGGRFIPRGALMRQYDHKGRSLGSGTLHRLKDRFDAWAVYSNSVDGEAPVLIADGGQ